MTIELDYRVSEFPAAEDIITDSDIITVPWIPIINTDYDGIEEAVPREGLELSRDTNPYAILPTEVKSELPPPRNTNGWLFHTVSSIVIVSVGAWLLLGGH